MPPAIIPYWLCLTMVFGLLPTLHFRLLKRSQLSNASVSLLASFLFFTFPFYFECSEFAASTLIQAFCRIFFVLKSWEIATKDSSCIKTWSFWDYVEFLLTSDNRPLRVHRGCELQDPRASKKYGIVYPKDRNVHFYLSLGFKWIATWAAYGFTKAYFDVFPLQNLSGLVSPINISQLGNCLIYAIMLLCCLELSFAPLFAFVLVLDAPYAPIFNKPYIATSLRDFWSNRWNLIIKEFIHTLAFKPTLELCKSWFLKSEEALLSNMADDNPSQSDASIIVSPTQTVTQHNPVHMALALMAGFLFSGLLHEYIVFFFMGVPVFGENTMFFLLQGFLCLAQTPILQSLSKFGYFGNLISWVTTMFLLLIPSPLFLRAYTVNGILDLPIVPQGMIEFYKSFLSWSLSVPT